MKIQWVVVANRSGAKIFELRGKAKPKLIQEVAHPEGRFESASNINSDKAGRSGGSSDFGAMVALQKRTNPIEHIEDIFASKLASEIAKARHLNNFDGFSLVAEPHMLGKIKKALSPVTQRFLRASIKKDLAEFSVPRIIEILATDPTLETTLSEIDENLPRKREQWARQVIDTAHGRLGRTLEGGVAAKRNKGAGNAKRGKRAALARNK